MNKNQLKIKVIVLAVCFIIFGGLLFVANNADTGSEGRPEGLYFERGRVTSVLAVSDNPYFLYQTLEVELLTGEFAGMTIEVRNNLMDQTLREFGSGDRVMVSLSDFAFQVATQDRSIVLVVTIAFFLVLLSVIGGKRGIASVIGLIFEIATIIFILIPLTLAGHSPILMAILTGTLMVIVSITLLAGVGAKSLSAILGCLSGMIIAALFAMIASHFAFITGFHTNQAGFLNAIADNLSITGIFISGVIIASIGAIADSSISIASAMEEVKSSNPDITAKELAKAGFNVGRDVMGTMSNTLILAFVGSSFGLVLINMARDVTLLYFLNTNGIGIEIIQGVAGSIGIILTVPITTLIATKLFFFRPLQKKSSVRNNY